MAPRPFDADELCELAERLSTIPDEPAVIAAEDVEAVAIDRTLDPGRANWMIRKSLRREARSGITTITKIL
jgi:hypothetical protein